MGDPAASLYPSRLDCVHARAQVSFITTPLRLNRPLVFHTFHRLLSVACVGLWVFWVFVQHWTIMEYTQGRLEENDLDWGSIIVPLRAKGRARRQEPNNQPLFFFNAGTGSAQIPLIWNHLAESGALLLMRGGKKGPHQRSTSRKSHALSPLALASCPLAFGFGSVLGQ